MNAISELRLALIMPALADKVRELESLCNADPVFVDENAKLEVTQGLRTWAVQENLWAQGRTYPGKRVTDARGGQSWHNYGCAVDVAPFANDQQPDWDETHPIWCRIVELGESIGLRSGISWKDESHFELTGQYPADPPQDVKDLFHSGGVHAVWDTIS